MSTKWKGWAECSGLPSKEVCGTRPERWKHRMQVLWDQYQRARSNREKETIALALRGCADALRAIGSTVPTIKGMPL